MKNILRIIPLVTCACFATHAQDSVDETARFKALDKNGDGVLSLDEFAAQTNRRAPAGKAVLSPEPTPKPVTNAKTGLIDWLKKYIVVRNSFFDSADSYGFVDEPPSDPARFSWTKPSDGDSFYQVDAAVLWNFWDKDAGWGTNLVHYRLQPSFEAHFSGEPDATQNQLTYRLPFELTLIPKGHAAVTALEQTGQVPETPWFLAHTFIVSPTYQSDQDNDVRTFHAEMLYTPTMPRLALGVQRGDFVKFRWRPFIGAEIGAFDDDNLLDEVTVEQDYQRFVARVLAELWFGDHFALTANYVHRTELSGAQHSFDYGEISAQYQLDDTGYFLTGATWKVGKDAPLFQNVNSISAWVGVKF